MNLSRFNHILLQVVLVPLVALLVMAAALYSQISSANRTVSVIQQSASRTMQLIFINKLIVDEETGLRGYHETLDQRFLAPYTQAQAPLDQQFASLSAVRGVTAQQRSQIEDLLRTHQIWHDSFAAPELAALAQGNPPKDLTFSLRGKQLIDHLRADLQILIQGEQQLRESDIERWHRQTHDILVALLILAVGLGLALGLFMRHRLHLVSKAYELSLAEALQRADTLYKSEQELRTTLISIGDGVIACDADGRISMMNPVAEHLTGWNQMEAVGLPLDQVFAIINETTRATVENPVSKVRRLNRVVGLANHTLLIRRDGTELCIADSGAPIRDQQGRIIGIVLVFRDVTVEKKTQDALIANEKFVVAGRLAATIAHEIHNPLDSVSNLLYLIRTGTSQEENRKFMAMAEQELTRVTQISRAMLGLYRESKAPVQIDLAEIIQNTLLLLERRLNRLRIKVDSILPEGILVEGFPSELRQVFNNLILNAAEAASLGGHIQIKLYAQPAVSDAEGRRTLPGATIEFVDNGPGIPPEVQPHLFQPFYTTKGDKGTGLGLWISRGIVLKHGGTIHLESSTSQTSHGTTVTVFLAASPTMQIGRD